jgi:hypothetical protein
VTAEAAAIAAAMAYCDMGPGFGKSMRAGKASAAQTANMGTAEVTASEVRASEVTASEVGASAKVATAPMTATAMTATATASESSCWDRRAAQKDSGNSHNHRFFHH